MDLIVNGKNAHAATGGLTPPDGAPSLILIHGAGMDGTVWSMQSRYFARHGHRVLALDLPNHGQSEGPALLSINDMAEWVIDFMDASGIETAALAGHSMGSFIALHVAGLAPGRVTGLALLGTAAAMPIHPDLQAAADDNSPLAGELITDWGFSPDMHRGGHQLPGYWAMGAGLALLSGAKKGTLSADLKACSAYQGALEVASRITCPTAFILGEFDKMTPPKQAENLADAMAHCQVTLIPRAGHMMMVEKPFETGKALKTIL